MWLVTGKESIFCVGTDAIYFDQERLPRLNCRPQVTLKSTAGPSPVKSTHILSNTRCDEAPYDAISAET